MKKVKLKSFVILLIIICIIICIITCASKFIYKENQNEEIIKESIKLKINYKKEIENLSTISTSKRKLDLINQLKMYDSNSTEMRRIRNKTVYGTNIDTSMNNVILKSTGIWFYDLNNNKLNYYKYSNQKRIWDFIVENDKLYYVELSDDREDGIYEWKLYLSDLDFSNSIVLKKGQIYNEVNSPFFVTSDDSNKILFVSYNDDIKNSENNEWFEKYISSYSIEIIDGKNFEQVICGEGDHVNKKGVFLQRSDYATRLKKDEIIYTEVSYFDKEITYSFNIKSKDKKVVYTNDELETYSLTETIRTEDGYALSYSTSTNNGKLVLVDNNLNILKELEFDGYKIFREIYNGNLILYNGLYNSLPYSVLSFEKAQFTKKFDFTGENMGHFFLTDGNKLLLFELGSEYYLYELP